ncbi:MAG: 30S ribosomal protein S3 [Cyanobacteria bacterium HKST-UBA06]|nr:30S ribosomal protein S3 [Cyanobacteria bacterium HKST-UBA04]MCA9806980.1 30S ribosomal protein S3 [Cyanobacteria bacterium HKST-UBA06]MCA9841721.1 30S ribosomal protein S3 [Cyanobacteria bacterium HKST-UBA03]
MGQKVHPKAVRLGVIQRWDSQWIAFGKEYAYNVAEDHKIRAFLKKKLKNAMVSRIEIDRKAAKLIVRIVTGRPGVIVGRGGSGLDVLRTSLSELLQRKDIQLDVLEVARIDLDAQLVAESIAQQLEKRVAFRRAMKQAMQRTLRSGAKGIKIMVSGRLGGAEIARTEWAKDGRVPLHTFRADIDYGFAEAMTVFGIIGVKTWVFKGEILPGDVRDNNVKTRRQPTEGAAGPVGGGPGGGGPGGDRQPGGRGKRRSAGGGRRSGAVTTKKVEDVTDVSGATQAAEAAPAQPQAAAAPETKPAEES